MAHAHDLLLPRERVFQPLFGAFGASDLKQHLHRVRVRAAVERAGEGRDRARDGAVHVGERPGDDAGGEGRGVQLVVGVEDEAHVEDARLALRGRLALEHVEEVRGEVQVRPRLYGVAPLAQPPDGGDEDGELRRQPRGRAQCALAREVARMRVGEGERRNGCAQGVHRLGAARESAHERQNLFGQPLARGQLAPERVQLVAPGQPTVPEQEDRLLEGRVLGEVVYVQPLVDEYAADAVNVTDRRLSRDHALKPRGRLRGRRGLILCFVHEASVLNFRSGLKIAK